MKAERSQYTVFKIEVLFDHPILFAEHSISSASVESTTIENPTAEDLKESGSLISFDCVVRGKPLTTRGTEDKRSKISRVTGSYGWDKVVCAKIMAMDGKYVHAAILMKTARRLASKAYGLTDAELEEAIAKINEAFPMLPSTADIPELSLAIDAEKATVDARALAQAKENRRLAEEWEAQRS